MESIQRYLKPRTADSQHPTMPEETVEWLESAALDWNHAPTAVTETSAKYNASEHIDAIMHSVDREQTHESRTADNEQHERRP